MPDVFIWQNLSGIRNMTHYRLYFFDPIKRTVEVRELDSFDDATAGSSLFSFKLGQPLELWSALDW